MSFSKPKAQKQAVYQPQPFTQETIDEASLLERDRERRRAVTRGGMRSTVVAGDVQPTGQRKTLLGA
jgi:hypothetical protein